MGGEGQGLFNRSGNYDGRNKCAGTEYGIGEPGKFGTKRNMSGSSVPKGKKKTDISKKMS